MLALKYDLHNNDWASKKVLLNKLKLISHSVIFRNKKEICQKYCFILTLLIKFYRYHINSQSVEPDIKTCTLAAGLRHTHARLQDE